MTSQVSVTKVCTYLPHTPIGALVRARDLAGAAVVR